MSMPSSSAFLPLGLLKHASEVYTFFLFRDFETDFKFFMASNVQATSTNGHTSVYKFWMKHDPLSTQHVTYNAEI